MEQSDGLPKGTWICLPKLAPGTTKEEVSDFLKQHFLHIPPDFIRVKEFEGNAGAFVVMQDPIICELFNWALESTGDVLLNGWPVTGTLRRGRRES
jgi:hypothetical protein